MRCKKDSQTCRLECLTDFAEGIHGGAFDFAMHPTKVIASGNAGRPTIDGLEQSAT
jgi:hypothetical protein